MDKRKVDDHPYADVFLEEVTLYGAVDILTRSAHSYVVNLLTLQGGKKRPLWEWISWFLDWLEFTDFMEWKDECEKNEDTTTV